MQSTLHILGRSASDIEKHPALAEIVALSGVKVVHILPDVHIKNKYLNADYKCSVPSSCVIVTDDQHYYPQFRSRGIGCGMMVCSTGLVFEKGMEDVFTRYFKRLVSRPLIDDIAFGADAFARKVLKRGKTMLAAGRYGVGSAEWWRLAKGGAFAYVCEHAPQSDETAGFIRDAFESSGCHGEPGLDINADHFNSLWVNGSMLGVDDIRIGRMFGGNHFLETQRVSEIYDVEIAQKFNVHKDEVTIHAHSCGGMLESCLNRQMVEQYVKLPKYALVSYDNPVRESIFNAVSLLKNLGSIHRAALLLRLRDTATQMPELKNMSVMPVIECTHNDVEVKKAEQKIVYRHNVHKLYDDKLTVVSGRFDHPSYLVCAGPNAHLTHYSVDHGVGAFLERNTAGYVHGNSSVHRIRVHGRIFRLTRRGVARLLKREPGFEMLRMLEKEGIIRIVARLEPFLNLKMIY